MLFWTLDELWLNTEASLSCSLGDQNLLSVWLDTWHYTQMCLRDFLAAVLPHSPKNQRKIIRQNAMDRRGCEKYEKLCHLLDGKLHSSLLQIRDENSSASRISQNIFCCLLAWEAWKLFLNIYILCICWKMTKLLTLRIKMSHNLLEWPAFET